MSDDIYQAIITSDAKKLEALLAAGANPNSLIKIVKLKNAIYTPLQLACIRNQPDLAKLLLEYHADPNILDQHGFTALAYACKDGYEDIVRLLLKAEYATDITQTFPWFIAKRNGHDNIAKLLPVSFGQDWLLQLMQCLGYRIHSKALCYGLPQMAKFAVHLRKIDKFNQRLISLVNIYLSAGAENLTRAKVIAEMEKIKDKNLVTEIYALFDGLKLSQDAAEKNDSHHLFPDKFKESSIYQIDQAISSLLLPVEFKDEQTPVYCQHFSGAYVKTEVEIYLQQLRLHLRKMNLAYPVTCLLFGNGHAMHIAYDAAYDHWIPCNANNLPIKIAPVQTHEDIMHVANKIVRGFYSNTHAIFATCVYAANSDKEKVLHALHALGQDKAWQAIHAVTKDKMLLKSQHGQGWLTIAKKHGDVKTVAAFTDFSSQPRKNHFLNRLGLFPIIKKITNSKNNASISVTRKHGKVPSPPR
jgi:hypothetical protein